MESDIGHELSIFLKENNVLIQKNHCDSSKLIDILLETNPLTDSSFYIINLGSIIRRYNLWKELFPDIEPRYAVKANPNIIICELLARLGCGFDVASVSEINLVKDLVDKDKIIFANPVKKPTSIQFSRSIDVDLLVFDNECELFKIKSYHPQSKLLLRIKVDDSESVCRFSEKFGIEKESIKQLLNLAKIINIDVCGVSFHIGSSCKNPVQYYKALELTKYAFDVSNEVGLNFNMIDIGGGFPGTEDETSMKLLKECSLQIYKGLDDFFHEYNYCNTEESSESDSEELDHISSSGHGHKKQIKLISEPGRFFVTSSHIIVISVIGKKVMGTGPDKICTYYVSESTYGSFGCINYDFQRPEIKPYNNRDLEKFHSIIYGHTCDSMDKISSDILLPELELGDTLYVENFGSYTTASASTFNGFNPLKNYYILN